MPDTATKTRTTADFDKFRLRRFVERLVDMDEVEVHDEPVPLSQISPIIEATPKAVLFRKTGPEQVEMAAAVSGSRARLAAAFETTPDKMREVFAGRLANRQGTYEVPSDEAPVHEVVLTGDEIDLTKLPFHVQHEFDGAPYISSGIDYTRDPLTGRSNLGCRRLMLRGKQKCGFNLTAPSDLRAIYLGCVERGEKLEASFTIGAHPLDTLAAATRAGGQELETIGTFRGEPLPLVKCLTNSLEVPADAEIVLEGYFDERGYVEEEGPFGEYMGFYGPMHPDPVFHVTAITKRKDVLYQSVEHGVGRKLGEMDSGPMSQLQTENRAFNILRNAGLDPVALYAPGSAGVGGHLRVAMRCRKPGDSRTAMTLLMGNMMTLKHVFVMDEDVDVFDDNQFDWVLATRFQADKDLLVLPGLPGMPMDPSATVRGVTAKAGFDLTFPFPRSNKVTARVPKAPTIGGPVRFQTVRQALESKPMYFAELMSAVGSDDGREVVMEIEALRDEGVLTRLEDGEYTVKKS